MKAAFFERGCDDRSQFRRALKHVNSAFHRGTVQEVVGTWRGERDDCEVPSVFVRSRLDREHLNCFPALRLTCIRPTGFDHIDLVEADRRGITARIQR